MNHRVSADQPLPHSVISWCLRVVIALQCTGAAIAVLLAPVEKQPALQRLLITQANFSAETARSGVHLATWAMLICGLLLLFIPLLSVLERRLAEKPLQLLPSIVWQAPLLLTVVAWQVFYAIASTASGSDYSQWSAASQAVRWATPLALLLLAPSLRGGLPSTQRMDDAVSLLRFAAAATFTAHGVKALLLHKPFEVLVINSARNLIWLDASAVSIAPLLQLIGVLDILLAVLLVTTRWRWVPAYMAAWGFIAAASRITAHGLYAYPEALLRTANGGAALAVFLVWCVWLYVQRQADEERLESYNR